MSRNRPREAQVRKGMVFSLLREGYFNSLANFCHEEYKKYGDPFYVFWKVFAGHKLDDTNAAINDMLAIQQKKGSIVCCNSRIAVFLQPGFYEIAREVNADNTFMKIKELEMLIQRKQAKNPPLLYESSHLFLKEIQDCRAAPKDQIQMQQNRPFKMCSAPNGRIDILSLQALPVGILFRQIKIGIDNRDDRMQTSSSGGYQLAYNYMKAK